jgi:hypothetical protein
MSSSSFLVTQKTAVKYKTIVACRFGQVTGRVYRRMHSSEIQHASSLGASPSALRTEPSENEFAFANNSLTEGARGRVGHVKPFHVLNIAAAVANEMVMPHASGIESCGATLDGHFPHQTRPHQVPQIVISRGPGRTRIHTIHGFEDFRSRGMPVAFHQECHHRVALRSTPQPATLQGPFNRIRIHEKV